MCPDSLMRCALRSCAVARHGLASDRRHRHKRLWISALQFAKGHGTPTLALEKAMSEDVIATCHEIDAEIVRVVFLGAAPGNVGSASDSGARRPFEDSRHGKGMPRSPRRYVSGVRRPCESGFAGCRRQGFIDSRVYKGTRILTLSEYLRAG